MLTAVSAPSRSPVRSQRLCYLFFLFLAGCLVGWVYEELFYWASEGLLRNRGVLYGPWLPIYGLGALVIYAMKPLKRRPALLFALCVAATGLVEYLIGWAGIHCLGLRLWDYRGLIGSIDGIVCLRSVLSFGVLGMVFHYLLEPMAARLYRRFQPRDSQALAEYLALILCCDCVLSALFRTPITY